MAHIMHHMHQLFTYTIICIVLACDIAIWKPVQCGESACKMEVQKKCCDESAPVKSTCSKNDGCSRDKDANTNCCCVCRVNCCYYLVPVFDYRLRLPEEESVKKPFYPEQFTLQSFNASIWRPPSEKVNLTIMQDAGGLM